MKSRPFGPARPAILRTFPSTRARHVDGEGPVDVGLLPDSVVGDPDVPAGVDAAAEGLAIGRTLRRPAAGDRAVADRRRGRSSSPAGSPGRRRGTTRTLRCPRRKPATFAGAAGCGCAAAAASLRCSSSWRASAGAASRSRAAWQSAERYPVAARPVFFCQAAIISRDRAPNTPSLPPVENPSAVSPTWIRWRSGWPRRSAASAASAPLRSASSAFRRTAASASALLRASLSACCRAAACGRRFSGGLALCVFDGPSAGGLLRLRLLAYFFLDLAPQGRFLFHLATSVGFGAQACGLLECRPLRSARLFSCSCAAILAGAAATADCAERRWRWRTGG